VSIQRPPPPPSSLRTAVWEANTWSFARLIEGFCECNEAKYPMSGQFLYRKQSTFSSLLWIATSLVRSLLAITTFYHHRLCESQRGNPHRSSCHHGSPRPSPAGSLLAKTNTKWNVFASLGGAIHATTVRLCEPVFSCERSVADGNPRLHRTHFCNQLFYTHPTPESIQSSNNHV